MMKKKYLKSFFIFIISGWKNVDIFGYPPVYNKHNIKTYLITSGDGTIIDHCQYYGKDEKNNHVWQQAGFPSDIYPEYRNVKLWKPLKKTRKWAYIACN